MGGCGEVSVPVEAFAKIRQFCLTLPGTVETEPWGPGEHSFRIAGRSFCFVTRRDGHANVSVKPPESERDAWLTVAGVRPAPYLGRYGWLAFTATDGDPEALDLAQALIWQSYVARRDGGRRTRRGSAGPADLVVQSAVPADLPALATLRFAHWREDRQNRDLTPAGARRAFRRTMEKALFADLAAGSLLAWLGSLGGRPVGCLFLRPVIKVPWPDSKDARFGYVSGVYVAPRARRKHVGQSLVRAAQDFAVRQRLEFLVLWPSEVSHDFYRSTGFTPAAGEEHPWLWSPHPSALSSRDPGLPGPAPDRCGRSPEPVR